MAHHSSHQTVCTSFLLALSLVALGMAAAGSSRQPGRLLQGAGGTKRVFPVRPSGAYNSEPIHLADRTVGVSSTQEKCSAPCGCHGISHLGGPIMSAPIKVYLIWYGDWSKKQKSLDIIKDLFSSVSSSKMWQTQASYCSINGKANAAPKVSVGGVLKYTKGYKKNMQLSDDGVQAIVTAVIGSGVFKQADPNAIYYVITSNDILQGDKDYGFCQNYCGWHNFFTLKGKSIKYSFVGDAARCPSSCSTLKDGSGKDLSPNGDFTADSMASVLIHELEEAASDPEPNSNPAWRDVDGDENADKCSWKFGFDPLAVPNHVNGKVANTQIGKRRFLIQQNWVNKQDKVLGNGYCGGHQSFTKV